MNEKEVLKERFNKILEDRSKNKEETLWKVRHLKRL